MNVIIFAPCNIVTGGVELAHQLCYELNAYAESTGTDITAKMCYNDISKSFEDRCRDIPEDKDAPDRYAIYNTEHITDRSVIDREDTVLVIPETSSLISYQFTRAKKVLWWMSVDNYISCTDEKDLDLLAEHFSLHLYQSEYARQYVSDKIPGAELMPLTDYINLQHGTFLYPGEFRKNLALYNPKKGLQDLKPLIERTQSWLQWLPLINLDVEKEILYMQMARIYVDFGPHPGMDRIPREAAVNGCCVITNKKGSAANDVDVPIPAKYKFEDMTALDDIEKLMHDICDDFTAHQNDFALYRERIHGEKKRFEQETAAFAEALCRM